ncbi:hypothetical protein L3X07_03280 [Levilactobacillus brevis]|nr:hypothetical protein [Levilactobacillus brevis]
MAQSQVFQTIESTVYLYGGHFQQNFPNWHYPQEQHQLFEMIVVLQERRPCLWERGGAYYLRGSHDYHPETAHESFNFCGNRLRFFCFHFSVGDLALKTQIIQNLGNTVLAADTPLAQAAQRLIQRFSALQATQQQPDWTLNMEIAFCSSWQLLVKHPESLHRWHNYQNSRSSWRKKWRRYYFRRGRDRSHFKPFVKDLILVRRMVILFLSACMGLRQVPTRKNDVSAVPRCC